MCHFLKDSEYGCCDDLVTPAKNADLSNCPSDCFYSVYGCCPDGKTTARGSNQAGCPITNSVKADVKNLRKETKFTSKPFDDPNEPCANKKYECCPDGVTAATGPGFQGCNEDTTYLKNTVFKYSESSLFEN